MPVGSSRRGSVLINLSLTTVAKPMPEETQYLVAGGDGRLAGFVDQMGGHDAVRRGDVALEERRQIGVGGTVGKHPADEAIAKRLGIGREALRHAELVAGKAI